MAITAEESEDGIPRVIGSRNFRTGENYDDIYFGGKMLINPPAFSKTDGFKNTQALVEIGGGDPKENKREYLDQKAFGLHYDYDLWPNRHPYEYYAAKLCHEYGPNNTTGKWYLPAIDELIKTFDNDNTEDMFNVDDYDYKNCNFTWDSIMFATSTLVMNEYG